MPKQFSNGKQTGFTTHKQIRVARAPTPGSSLPLDKAADRSPRMAAQAGLSLKEDLSEEGTREQLGSDILLIPLPKSQLEWSRGVRDLELSPLSLFPTEGGRGTCGSGNWG